MARLRDAVHNQPSPATPAAAADRCHERADTRTPPTETAKPPLTAIRIDATLAAIEAASQERRVPADGILNSRELWDYRFGMVQ